MDENSGLPPSAAPPPPPYSAPPPPPPPPPRITLPPPLATPPPPPRRSSGWMIVAIVLLVLLGVSLLWNLLSFAGSLMHSRNVRYTRSVGPRIDEVMLEDNDAVDKIAVIPMTGIITSQVIDQGGFSMVEVVKAELKRAFEDDRVKAVILKVNSPGGEVLASDEIYRAIEDFQKKKYGKPVVASMGDLAASGGYYVSSPCRWIVANELTLTGSIGVILHSYNYRGLMDKVGLLPEVYKSGRFKDMLSGEREPGKISSEERDMIQKIINESYSRFTNVVVEGRNWAHQKNKDSGVALSSNWSDFADGRVLSGKEAIRYGFVDQLGDFEDAVERARKLTGTAAANVVEYQQRYDLSDLLHLFGKSESRTVKVDLGIDAPKLRAGQLYYLSPTFLHQP